MTNSTLVRITAAAFIAVFPAVSAVAQEWAGKGRVVVMVQGPDQEPVADARLTFELARDESISPDKDFRTDDKGKFSFLGLHGGEWMLEVVAAGYERWRQPVVIYSQGMPETILVNLERMAEEKIQAIALGQAGEAYDKGRDLEAAGDFAGARQQYLKALEALDEARKPDLLAPIAGTYLNEGKLAEATAVLDEALAIDPEHVSSLKTLCVAVAAQGDPAAAEAILARIPEDEEIHPNTLMNIAMTNYNTGKTEAAKTYLDRVIRDDPETVQAYYFRGLTSLSLGDNDAALADFEHFLELAPDHPQAAEVNEYLGYLRAVPDGE